MPVPATYLADPFYLAQQAAQTFQQNLALNQLALDYNQNQLQQPIPWAVLQGHPPPPFSPAYPAPSLMDEMRATPEYRVHMKQQILEMTKPTRRLLWLSSGKAGGRGDGWAVTRKRPFGWSATDHDEYLLHRTGRMQARALQEVARGN